MKWRLIIAFLPLLLLCYCTPFHKSTRLMRGKPPKVTEKQLKRYMKRYDNKLPDQMKKVPKKYYR